MGRIGSLHRARLGCILLIAGGTLAVTALPRRAAAATTSGAAAHESTAAGAGAADGRAEAQAPACDSTTPLSILGMDTASGTVLFAVPGDGRGGGWVIEMDGGGSTARGFPEGAAGRPGRYGGSVGPGPVVALEPCGAACVQPVRWNGGTWQPLGGTVTVPSGSTVAATWDESGAPWLVAHAAGGQEGQVRAWSFRLEGSDWQSHGNLTVTAVSQPQAVPAPQRKDGVVSGTGLFAASGPPVTWVAGLPGLPPERRGQLLALPGNAAAYVAADGVAYLSADQGKTWRRSTWTPWGGGDTTGIWRQGKDYGIDLPFGDHRGLLQLVWFDRRRPASEEVVLTRETAAGDWLQLGQAPVDVTTRNGDHLPITQVLVPRPDTWILLSGCATTATGSGLVLRSLDKGHLSEPRFVPLTAAPGH